MYLNNQGNHLRPKAHIRAPTLIFTYLFQEGIIVVASERIFSHQIINVCWMLWRLFNCLSTSWNHFSLNTLVSQHSSFIYQRFLFLFICSLLFRMSYIFSTYFFSSWENHLWLIGFALLHFIYFFYIIESLVECSFGSSHIVSHRAHYWNLLAAVAESRRK